MHVCMYDKATMYTAYFQSHAHVMQLFRQDRFSCHVNTRTHCQAHVQVTQVFAPNAPTVMEVLMSGHKGQIDAEDTQISYLMQAAARIAKCMKASFVPYMQHILPPVIAYAQLDPKLDFQVSGILFVHMFSYIYIYIYIYTCVCVYIYIYMCVYYMYIYVYECGGVCVCVQLDPKLDFQVRSNSFV
jgi:hypothetical protein